MFYLYMFYQTSFCEEEEENVNKDFLGEVSRPGRGEVQPSSTSPEVDLHDWPAG